jgi:arsenite methyltransferase
MRWQRSFHCISAYRRLTLLLLAALLAGCATLKQCAYEGFNRDKWQQPDRIIQSLDIRPGQTVADIGSGSGYFALHLARAVGPAGEVYAVDTDENINQALKSRAKKEQAKNIHVVLGRDDDPLLPVAVDLIFTSNTYHHIGNRVSYFAGLRKYLKPDGRIVIIDFDDHARFEAFVGHATPAESIKAEMERAGYRLQRRFDYLDRQSFMMFTPGFPTAPGAKPDTSLAPPHSSVGESFLYGRGAILHPIERS